MKFYAFELLFLEMFFVSFFSFVKFVLVSFLSGLFLDLRDTLQVRLINSVNQVNPKDHTHRIQEIITNHVLHCSVHLPCLDNDREVDHVIDYDEE